MLLFKILIPVLGLCQAAELPLFETYTEQREFFTQQVKVAQSSDLWAIEMNSVETPNLYSEEKLFTDFVWVRQKRSTGHQKKVVVISSGIHGIEGYVGSALQSQVLSSYLNKMKNPNLDLLLIHTLNPWGMNFKRRVNSNNVDLNRSFDFSADLFQTENLAYTKIFNFLNPQRRYEESVWNKPLFVLDSIFLLVKSSMKIMRQAVLQGQYKHDNGLYFGGKVRQTETQRIMALATELDKKYDQIFWIDLHTGYGQRGTLHLLADREPKQNMDRLKNIFAGLQIDETYKDDFYKTSGDLVGYLTKSYPEKLTSVVFEYGTLDSQKTLGSIESLRRMVVENQVFFQNQNANPLDAKFDQKEFIEMFRPTDLLWRNSVVKQSETALGRIFENF